MSSSPKYENLLEFKFDLSCIQSGLTQALLELNNKITHLHNHNRSIEQKMEAQFSRVNHELEVSSDRIGCLDRSLQDTISDIRRFMQKTENTENNKTVYIEKATPSMQVPQLPKPQRKDSQKQNQSSKPLAENPIIVNTSDSKTDHDTIHAIDQKCYDLYVKIMQKVEQQIEQTKTNLKAQLDSLNSGDKITRNVEQTTQINVEEAISTIKSVLEHSEPKQSRQNLPTSIKNVSKEQSNQLISSQSRGSIEVIPPVQSNSHSLLCDQLTKQKIMDYVYQAQRKFREETIQVSNEEDLVEIKRANSVFADHLVEIKKNIEDLNNTTDAIKIEANGTSDKGLGVERKVCSLSEKTSDLVARIKSIENKFTLLEEAKNCNDDPQFKQNQVEGESMKSISNIRKDPMQDSRTNFRVLGPIKASQVSKQTSNRFEAIEENYKKMSNKLNSLLERFNRMEDDKKRFRDSQGLLPKIEKEGKSNINHYQLIKKDLKATNEQINKSNERITTMKQRLNELYESHAHIPNKIEDLYQKLREHNQFQEDRLIQLIKELVNRMLSDPFDNHFTNRLKRQINVKFLEIKHEYHTILKEIQNKVEDRAEKSELHQITDSLKEAIAETKALNAKKCENQDFKKGIKYLENKIKDVFQFTKNETNNLYNEQKQYIGVKKQAIH